VKDRTPAPLVGVAVGDALGAPFEGRMSLSPLLLDWDGHSYLPTRNNWLMIEPGQVTDDTQMTVALAKSLVQEKTFNPSAVMESYYKWFQSGSCRGMGNTVREAILKYLRTKSPTTCGVAGSQGNGTAMRVSPIGLAFRHDLDLAARYADVDASLTHQSPEARHGSMAIALGVGLLALQVTTPTYLAKKVATMLPAGKLHDIFENFPQPLPRHSLAGYLKALPPRGVTADVAVVFALAAVATSFKEGIELAIRRGGDTDTIASMVGALLGAFYGLEGVDSTLLEPLEDRDALIALNHQLLTLADSLPLPVYNAF